MKINLCTKTVFIIIAISIGPLAFEQKPVKEAQATNHTQKSAAYLSVRMKNMERDLNRSNKRISRLEKHLKRLESDFVVVVKDFRRRIIALEKKAKTQIAPKLGVAPREKVNAIEKHSRSEAKFSKKKKIQSCERKWVAANLPINNRVPGQRQAILKDFISSNCCGLKLKPRTGGHKNYCASRR